MNIFGISSADGLITLLLVETGWWTTELFSVVFPATLIYLEDSWPAPLSFYYFVSFLLFLSKFLTQGVLWYAFLFNKATEDHGLVKNWYWASILVDLILISWEVGFEALNISAVLSTLLPFFIVRTIIWSFGTPIVNDTLERTLFPEGFFAYLYGRDLRTTSIVLTWELIWYTVSVIGIFLSQYVSTWTVFIPAPNFQSWGIFIVYLLTVPISFLGVIGIGIIPKLKGWSSRIVSAWVVFIRVWLVFYLMNNVTGYCVTQLTYAHENEPLTETVMFYPLFAINLMSPICAVGLKLIAVLGTVRLIFYPGALGVHNGTRQ